MIWTATSESLLNKLQVLQKKAVQIVNKSALRALFNKFQLLKLKQIGHFQILGFMYKFTHGLLPAGFIFAHSPTSIHTTQEQQVSRFCTKYFICSNKQKKEVTKDNRAISVE